MTLLFPNTFSEHQPINHVKWSNYNQSLVRHSEILIGFDVINNWDAELKRDEQRQEISCIIRCIYDFTDYQRFFVIFLFYFADYD